MLKQKKEQRLSTDMVLTSPLSTGTGSVLRAIIAEVFYILPFSLACRLNAGWAQTTVICSSFKSRRAGYVAI